MSLKQWTDSMFSLLVSDLATGVSSELNITTLPRTHTKGTINNQTNTTIELTKPSFENQTRSTDTNSNHTISLINSTQLPTTHNHTGPSHRPDHKIINSTYPSSSPQTNISLIVNGTDTIWDQVIKNSSMILPIIKNSTELKPEPDVILTSSEKLHSNPILDQ